MTTKNDRKRLVRKIAKSNAGVDERIVMESIELVNFSRRFHHKGGRRFGILPSSEASLKIKPPILHTLG